MTRPLISQSTPPTIGPRITTQDHIEYFADLTHDRWFIVARRPRLAEAWSYWWSACDTRLWRNAVMAGRVLVVQRYDPGGVVVALGRVAGLAPTRPARHAAPTAQPLRSHHGYQA